MTKKMMAELGSTFLKGLFAVLPIVVTIYLLYWLGGLAESVLGGIIKATLPFYFPGMGILVAIGGIFTIGLLLNAWLIRKVFSFGESLMRRIPLVKTIYGGVKDLTHFLSRSSSDASSQVVTVSVTIAGVEARLLGLVTRTDFEGLPEQLGGPGDIAVYLPMSYQIGGYTLLLPRDRVTVVNMSIDKAMRFAVTAGMSVSREGEAIIDSSSAQK